MTDNELVPRSELCTWSRKLHIYDGVWKHLLPTFHQSAIGREWRFPWDNFRYPVRWWSVQTTLPAGTHTHFLVFFFPLPLSCLFIQLIRFPGSLPSPSSHGERFMFSMTTCPLSPSSNICLWRREEGEKLPGMMRRIRQSADVILAHFNNCTFYAWNGYVLLFYPESPCVVLKNILPLFHTSPVWVRECHIKE